MARKRIFAACVAIGMALAPAAARGGDPSPVIGEQGPFSERNQLPFNLLFLAFPARGGALLSQGEKELLVVEAYGNTFSGSDVLVQINTDERVRLTPEALLEAQLTQPGESLFFLDTEQARTSLMLRWGASRRFELDLEVPFLSYFGGQLDSAIEWYHNFGSFGNADREHFVQDAVQLALTLGDKTYFRDSSPSHFRPSDAVITGRLGLADSPRGSAALSMGVKLPTGSAEDLSGSGSFDEGLEMEGTLRWGRQRVHLSGGWVHVGDWDLFPEFNPTDLANFGAAYEYVRNARLSWVFQLQTQSSVFRNHEDADGYLADFSTELLLGARWKGASGRWAFQTALIENLIDQNNGMDVGILAGFSVLSRPAP